MGKMPSVLILFVIFNLPMVNSFMISIIYVFIVTEFIYAFLFNVDITKVWALIFVVYLKCEIYILSQ